MQLKRIIVFCLVAILILTSGVVLSSAETSLLAAGEGEAKHFDLAVEANASTAVFADDGIYLKKGDSVEISVVVRKSDFHDVFILGFSLKYNSAVVAPQLDNDDRLICEITDLPSLSPQEPIVSSDSLYFCMFPENFSAGVDFPDDCVLVKVGFTVIADHGDADFVLDYDTADITTVSALYDRESFRRTLVADAYDSTTDGYIGANVFVHALDDVPMQHEATCTSAKSLIYTCQKCEKLVFVSEGEALGHNPETDAAIPATCTVDGKSEGSHCSRCGEVLTAQETVPATGHDFGEWSVTKEAGLFSLGEETRTCVKCGFTENREFSKSQSYTVLWILMAIVIVLLTVVMIVAFSPIKKKPARPVATGDEQNSDHDEKDNLSS